MAIGSIVSLSVNPDGFSGTLRIEGFSVGCTYDFGLGANNDLTGSEKLILTVTSMGFNGTTPTTWPRTIYGTFAGRKIDLNPSSKDESIDGSDLVVTVIFNEYIYAKDQAGGGNSGTDIVCTIAAGLVTNTAGGGQQSLARSSFTVTNNSTVAYQKPQGRWAWPGFESFPGDYVLEFVTFSPYGRDGKPVSAVAFDATDAAAVSVPQQVITSMTLTPRTSGDANKIGTYSATMDTSGLTNNSQITNRARVYPWIGDSGAILDTDVSADGVAAPSESLSPLMSILNRNGSLTVYACVDGVGAGTPAASASEATASANPFSTVTLAMNAAKSFNNTNNSDNTLNFVVIMLKAGSYAGPGTFTGGNTKCVCIIRPDYLSGATKATAIINSGANQVCNAYLKADDITFSGSAAGVFRGSTTTGLLWLHSCSLGNTSTSFVYAQRVCFATQNTVTATSVTGFKQFSTNRGSYGLIRGNDASAITGGMVGNVYAILGNKGVQVGSGFNESGVANDLSDNSIIAWNSAFNMSTLFLNNFFLTSESTKGIAIVGNLAEKTSSTNPFIQVAGDNSYKPLTNVLIANCTIAGQRSNLGYCEAGNTFFLRSHYFDRFNLMRDFNCKTWWFANPQRTLNDAVITDGSTTLTSASGNFTAADNNAIISFDGVANGFCNVASIVNSTTITLTVAANTSASSVTVGMRGYLANVNRTGNLAWVYGVGCRGSRYEISNFPREFDGIDIAAVGSQALGYVNDKSLAGAGGGNGDYSLDEDSPGRNRVPAGMALMPFDLFGTAISNTGTGAAGAIQPPAPDPPAAGDNDFFDTWEDF